MRGLLCWCICLFVSNQMLVAGGWWSVVGTITFGDTHHSTQAPKAAPANHQPPATSHLPCADSSPACLETLGALAVQNSREIAVLEQAIALQKKKLWTSWLQADGLNPLAIGLRIARNLAGGGDRAVAKLELARLELRRAELVTQLRDAIVRAVFAYEIAQRRLAWAEARLVAHRTQWQWFTIAYRLGEGSTETMLTLWQTEIERAAEARQAQTASWESLRQLQDLIFPTMTIGHTSTLLLQK